MHFARLRGGSNDADGARSNLVVRGRSVCPVLSDRTFDILTGISVVSVFLADLKAGVYTEKLAGCSPSLAGCIINTSGFRF